MTTVTITWNGDPSGLIERLRQIADPLPHVAIFSLPGRQPLLVAIAGETVRVRLRPGFGGNDFAPVLQGKIAQKGDVSLLTATFGIDRHVRLFMYGWSTSMVVLGVVCFLFADRKLIWLLLFVGALVGGLLMPRVLAHFSRDQKTEIVDLLRAGIQPGTVTVNETA